MWGVWCRVYTWEVVQCQGNGLAHICRVHGDALGIRTHSGLRGQGLGFIVQGDDLTSTVMVKSLAF